MGSAATPLRLVPEEEYAVPVFENSVNSILGSLQAGATEPSEEDTTAYSYPQSEETIAKVVFYKLLTLMLEYIQHGHNSAKAKAKLRSICQYIKTFEELFFGDKYCLIEDLSLKMRDFIFNISQIPAVNDLVSAIVKQCNQNYRPPFLIYLKQLFSREVYYEEKNGKIVAVVSVPPELLAEQERWPDETVLLNQNLLLLELNIEMFINAHSCDDTLLYEGLLIEIRSKRNQLRIHPKDSDIKEQASSTLDSINQRFNNLQQIGNVDSPELEWITKVLNINKLELTSRQQDGEDAFKHKAYEREYLSLKRMLCLAYTDSRTLEPFKKLMKKIPFPISVLTEEETAKIPSKYHYCCKLICMELVSIYSKLLSESLEVEEQRELEAQLRIFNNILGVIKKNTETSCAPDYYTRWLFDNTMTAYQETLLETHCRIDELDLLTKRHLECYFLCAIPPNHELTARTSRTSSTLTHSTFISSNTGYSSDSDDSNDSDLSSGWGSEGDIRSLGRQASNRYIAFLIQSKFNKIAKKITKLEQELTELKQDLKATRQDNNRKQIKFSKLYSLLYPNTQKDKIENLEMRIDILNVMLEQMSDIFSYIQSKADTNTIQQKILCLISLLNGSGDTFYNRNKILRHLNTPRALLPRYVSSDAKITLTRQAPDLFQALSKLEKNPTFTKTKSLKYCTAAVLLLSAQYAKECLGKPALASLMSIPPLRPIPTSTPITIPIPEKSGEPPEQEYFNGFSYQPPKHKKDAPIYQNAGADNHHSLLFPSPQSG